MFAGIAGFSDLSCYCVQQYIFSEDEQGSGNLGSCTRCTEDNVCRPANGRW